jgi:hypothetical protein
VITGTKSLADLYMAYCQILPLLEQFRSRESIPKLIDVKPNTKQRSHKKQNADFLLELSVDSNSLQQPMRKKPVELKREKLISDNAKLQDRDFVDRLKKKNELKRKAWTMSKLQSTQSNQKENTIPLSLTSPLLNNEGGIPTDSSKRVNVY